MHMAPIDRSMVQTLASAVGLAGIMLEPPGKILWLEDPTGLLEKPMPGASLADLLTTARGPGIPEILDEAFEGRVAQLVEVIPSPAHLSSRHPQRTFILKLVPADGGLLALISPSYRLHETASCQGETFYRKVLDLMPDGVALLNPDGCLGYANLLAANQFGYRVDEFVGHQLVDLVAPEDRAKAEAIISRSEHLTDHPIRFRVIRADGSMALAEYVSRRWVDEEGLHGSIAVLRDVTRLAHMQTRERMEHVRDAIATFAMGLADELEGLSETVGPALADLIDRLETISGVVRSRVAHVPIDFNEPVRAAVEALEPMVGRWVSLHVTLVPDLPEILGCAPRLTDAVVQLGKNAIAAMPLGGHLVIRTDRVVLREDLLPPALDARPGRFVMLTVQDDGVGIDPDILDRIFEPYFTTRSEEDGNQGLGLALVDSIVREHSGFVVVESQPGRGTRFRIYLPVLETRPAKDELVVQRGRETILLLDAEEGVRDTLQPLLSSWGFRVIVCGHDDEACDLLERHVEQVDAVVVELGPAVEPAPLEDLLATLRSIKSDLRILLVGQAPTELFASLGDRWVAHLPAGASAQRLHDTLWGLIAS